MSGLLWIAAGLVLWTLVGIPVALLAGRCIRRGTDHLDGRGGPPVIGRDARVEGVRDGEL